MREKVVAKLTKEEVEHSCIFIRQETMIRELMNELLEKRARLERERMRFWDQLIEKYGLEKGRRYSISHVLGQIIEEE